MAEIDRKATDLRDVVQDILHQFQVMDNVVLNGPHVELNVQELRLVEYLGDQGPKMMREVASYLILAVNSITNLVDNLENREIVRRVRSEEDRRIIRVELTPRGRAVYESALKEKLHMLRAFLEVLSDEEQDIFLLLFRKIARLGRTQVQKMASHP